MRKREGILHRGTARGSQIVTDYFKVIRKIPWTTTKASRTKKLAQMLPAEQMANIFWWKKKRIGVHIIYPETVLGQNVQSLLTTGESQNSTIYVHRILRCSHQNGFYLQEHSEKQPWANQLNTNTATAPVSVHLSPKIPSTIWPREGLGSLEAELEMKIQKHMIYGGHIHQRKSGEAVRRWGKLTGEVWGIQSGPLEASAEMNLHISHLQAWWQGQDLLQGGSCLPGAILWRKESWVILSVNTPNSWDGALSWERDLGWAVSINLSHFHL